MGSFFATYGELIKAYLITALVAYMLGSISFAVLSSRLFAKKDVRNYGSGNAGATNVFRSIGIKAGIATFLGDLGKGVLALVCSGAIFDAVVKSPELATFGARNIGMYIAGLMVLLGHMFPVYFDFRGGKGVMTLAGIILMLSPVRFAALFVIFAVAFAITRTVSVGSCACAIAYPIVTFFDVYFLDHMRDPAQYSKSYIIVQMVFAFLFAALVLFMHRGNIKRILNGTEPKMIFKNNHKKNAGGSAANN